MATHRLKGFSFIVNFGDASTVDRGPDNSQLDKLDFCRTNLAVETFLQFLQVGDGFTKPTQLSFCHSETEPRNVVLVQYFVSL